MSSSLVVAASPPPMDLAQIWQFVDSAGGLEGFIKTYLAPAIQSSNAASPSVVTAAVAHDGVPAVSPDLTIDRVTRQAVKHGQLVAEVEQRCALTETSAKLSAETQQVLDIAGFKPCGGVPGHRVHVGGYLRTKRDLETGRCAGCRSLANNFYSREMVTIRKAKKHVMQVKNAKVHAAKTAAKVAAIRKEIDEMIKDAGLTESDINAFAAASSSSSSLVSPHAAASSCTAQPMQMDKKHRGLVEQVDELRI